MAGVRLTMAKTTQRDDARWFDAMHFRFRSSVLNNRRTACAAVVRRGDTGDKCMDMEDQRNVLLCSQGQVVVCRATPL